MASKSIAVPLLALLAVALVISDTATARDIADKSGLQSEKPQDGRSNNVVNAIPAESHLRVDDKTNRPDHENETDPGSGANMKQEAATDAEAKYPGYPYPPYGGVYSGYPGGSGYPGSGAVYPGYPGGFYGGYPPGGVYGPGPIPFIPVIAAPGYLGYSVPYVGYPGVPPGAGPYVVYPGAAPFPGGYGAYPAARGYCSYGCCGGESEFGGCRCCSYPNEASTYKDVDEKTKG